MNTESKNPVNYDSRIDTLLHIKRVAELLTMASAELLSRATVHDNSKLESPEKELFDEFTPKLKDSTYGSEEYKQFLNDLKPALDHHYAKNSHHPEHYANGVNGFDLFDLVEMFFDWKAATERHADGDIMRSITINKERFGLSDQLCDILRNTAVRLRYAPVPDSFMVQTNEVTGTWKDGKYTSEVKSEVLPMDEAAKRPIAKF